MPIEYTLLKSKPIEDMNCKYCLLHVEEYEMRGQVQSMWRKFWRRPYCAIICPRCHSVTGWEKP